MNAFYDIMLVYATHPKSDKASKRQITFNGGHYSSVLNKAFFPVGVGIRRDEDCHFHFIKDFATLSFPPYQPSSRGDIELLQLCASPALGAISKNVFS